MAVTYQVFTRYLNEKVNKVITNKTKVEWYQNDYQDDPRYDDYQISIIKENIEKSINASSVNDVIAKQELFEISSENVTTTESAEHYEKIMKELDLTNPKYDMLFLYDGIGHKSIPTAGRTADELSDAEPEEVSLPVQSEIYYDKMMRTKLDPWFLYGQYASLTAALNVCKKLSNIYGIDGIKIGKVVPIDQYIDIK